MTECPEHIQKGRARWRIELKKVINERCVSESKLAKRIGVSTQQVRNIIDGDFYCSQNIFKKLNDALGIEARYYYWRKRRSDTLRAVTF